jgi:Complex I intermediate-associated protein 30 (CIA30)
MFNIKKYIRVDRIPQLLNPKWLWWEFFPQEGGGNARRWLRFQGDVLLKRRDFVHPLKGPISLFDFNDLDDAQDAKNPVPYSVHRWRFSDDSVIGGYSRGTVNLIQSKEDLERFERGEKPLHDKKDPDFLPFIRWKGTLDTNVGEDAPPRVVRSGFCNIRSPEFLLNGAVLTGRYNALELVLRTDGRMYWFNIHPDTPFHGDLHQSPINVPSSFSDATTTDSNEEPFLRTILVLKEFRHTNGGRIKEHELKLIGGVNISSIGITLMDGLDGDFQFDLASIRAVNYYDGLIFGEDDADAPY